MIDDRQPSYIHGLRALLLQRLDTVVHPFTKLSHVCGEAQGAKATDINNIPSLRENVGPRVLV